MNIKQAVVYILASKRNGTLYTGVTSNLVKRVWEHKQQFIDGFAEKHNASQLVYFELHNEMLSAITREKQIKAWKREWKLNLIEEKNPYWLDLWDKIKT